MFERVFGYDPYNAREFVERCMTDNGPYGIHMLFRVLSNCEVWFR